MADKCKRCGNAASGEHTLRVATSAVYGRIEVEEHLCEECADAFIARTREWIGLPLGQKKRRY